MKMENIKIKKLFNFIKSRSLFKMMRNINSILTAIVNMLSKPASIWRNVVIFLDITGRFFWLWVINVIYFCDAQLNFQHHYSSLQCHMIFRNHSNVLICCSRNISDYYQCWKQLCCTIFLRTPWHILVFRILWWIESSKEQHLFEMEFFCNIINVFTDQFNASLQNKGIN